jgi:DNA-directed RNA polymerase specialized sigma24 family protein
MGGRMDEQSELLELLRAISRSLAIQALPCAPVKFESNRERITYLAGLGHSAEDIAAILGIGLKNVSNRLAEEKSPAAARKRRG